MAEQRDRRQSVHDWWIGTAATRAGGTRSAPTVGAHCAGTAGGRRDSTRRGVGDPSNDAIIKFNLIYSLLCTMYSINDVAPSRRCRPPPRPVVVLFRRRLSFATTCHVVSPRSPPSRSKSWTTKVPSSSLHVLVPVPPSPPPPQPAAVVLCPLLSSVLNRPSSLSFSIYGGDGA